MAYSILKSYNLDFDFSELFFILSKERECFFLDTSLAPQGKLGRFSFLGCDPFYLLEAKNTDPFPVLRDLLSRYRINIPGSPLPFLGGAVGYLAYDLGFLLEPKVKKKTPDDLNIPDCLFGFYNTVFAADYLKKRLYIFSVGFPEKSSLLQQALCRENVKKAQRLLARACACKPVEKPKHPDRTLEGLKSNFSRQDYLEAVRKAKEYIRRGDIYQVNLSQRFSAKTELSAFEIYRRLRSLSPSYFGAYFDTGTAQIISSSPERFLKLEGNRVVTRPMKGTRARGRNPREDHCLRRQLLNSPKDRAELTMIVDLERNDLGRVCSYDSIRVTSLRELEKYSTVYQTTANIEGFLYAEKDRLDLLRACFPGGSITGCPKIRAMEIIEELEPSRRSIYTGALGYLSFSGDMDFNILIRTILKKQDRIYFGVGGGIVADSSAQAEYEETLVKARAMFEAIA